MRVAVPVRGERVSETLGGCEAVNLYEDDHGRIEGKLRVAVEGGAAAAAALLERRGVDVLLCAPLTAEERELLGFPGYLIAEGASGEADVAALRYLDAAVVSDPDNRCNRCGHRRECAFRTEK